MHSLGITSRFSSRSSLLRAAIAPPTMLPPAVMIVARKGLIAGEFPVVLTTIKPQYSKECAVNTFGTLDHRNFTESGFSRPAAKSSASVAFSAVVSSRISSRGGAMVTCCSMTGDGVVDSGSAAVHPLQHCAASQITAKTVEAVDRLRMITEAVTGNPIACE
jgi:hypothetical protein